MFYIQQNGKHDCAFTCLEMILANYHHDRNYLFLPHEDRPHSFKELISIGESYNLFLIGIKVADFDELRKCKRFPLLVTMKNAVGIHSVLLIKVKRKIVIIYDPASGLKEMSIDDFKAHWTTYALMIDHGQKTKVEPRPDFIAKRDKITLPILQLLSGFALLIGTFYIDKDIYVFIPIFLFALFIIFELLFRDNLLKAMKRMDNEIDCYFLKENICYRDFYEDVEKYRLHALTFDTNIIYSCLLSVFMMFIILMNDILNATYIAMAVVIALVESQFLDPIYRRHENFISEEENKIKTVNSEEEFKNLSAYVRGKSYHLALIKTISSYLSIAAILVMSIAIMAASNIVNITYVVFYTFITIFLKSNYKKMFTYSEKQQTRDYYRAKVISYLKEE